MQHHIVCFVIGQLNVQAVAQHRENSAAAYKVLPSGADLTATQSPQSYAKPEFIEQQNCCDGQYPDAMIKAFRALLDNTQETMHHLAI